MAAPKMPARLGARGRRLWREITEGYDLVEKPAELVMLEEACRIADRLEKLDEILSGDVDEWMRLQLPREGSGTVRVVVDGALAEARQQANQLKQLVAALRLPDEVSGKRPQQRGGARGSYQSNGTGSGSVSSLDRARARSGA
jgi:hypothetical protein